MDKRITIHVPGHEHQEESVAELLVELASSIMLTVLIFGLLVLAMV
jgi:hypothetical protein